MIGTIKTALIHQIKKEKNSYFCEHCKISGHSIEWCFKIYGYPNSTKSLPNKKFAANSVNSEENATHIEANHSGFTPTQYNTLFMLLGKKDTVNEKEISFNDASANLAGTLCQSSFYDDVHWIIDSGATDHMCNTIKLFQDLRDIRGNDHSITIPDGNKMVVKKIGGVHLKEGLILKMCCLFQKYNSTLFLSAS